MRRHPILVSLGSELPATWLGLVATLAVVAVGTLLVYPLKSVAPVVSLGIVYLLAILLISIVWGLRLGLLASVASAAAFNFFQIPPLHRFTIAEEENWVALAAFVIAAIISSTVVDLARARAVEAERRREQADRALAELLRTPLTSMIAGGSALATGEAGAGSPAMTSFGCWRRLPPRC